MPENKPSWLFKGWILSFAFVKFFLQRLYQWTAWIFSRLEYRHLKPFLFLGFAGILAFILLRHAPNSPAWGVASLYLFSLSLFVGSISLLLYCLTSFLRCIRASLAPVFFSAPAPTSSSSPTLFTEKKESSSEGSAYAVGDVEAFMIEQASRLSAMGYSDSEIDDIRKRVVMAAEKER